MIPLEVDCETWLAATEGERAALAEHVAGRVGGEVFSVRHGTDDLPLPSILVRGCEMVFVPGGKSTLGWTTAPSGLSEDALRRYEAETRVSFDERLRHALGPPREVTLPPFLLEATPTPVDRWLDPYGPDVERRLVEAVEQGGFRLVSDDEWEHAARAGRPTLFRWGDTWPPADSVFRGHLGRTDLGLTVSADPYVCELTAGLRTLRGGDGGCSMCSGETWPGDWISFALAFRVPREGWEDVVAETFETGVVRRALSIG